MAYEIMVHICITPPDAMRVSASHIDTANTV